MVYRPAQVYNGTGWDDIGDKRIGASAGDIPQASVANLTSDLAGKLATTVTTKGDLISRTTTAPTRLAVGSNGQVLTANSATTTGLQWTTLATGKILQVVSTTKTDVFSTTSGSYTDITGLSVSITPSSSASKVLVVASVMTSSSGVFLRRTPLRLLRGATAILLGDSSGSRTRVSSTASNQDVGTAANVMILYLDSPSTTSATTYKLQTLGIDTTTITVNRSANDIDNANHERGTSTIMALEIAA